MPRRVNEMSSAAWFCLGVWTCLSLLVFAAVSCATTRADPNSPASACVQRCEQLTGHNPGRAEVTPKGRKFETLSSCRQKCLNSHSTKGVGDQPAESSTPPDPFEPTPRID
jgi:hypothetical protein